MVVLFLDLVLTGQACALFVDCEFVDSSFWLNAVVLSEQGLSAAHE